MKLALFLVAILGYIYNIKEKKILSYSIWLVSNSGWAFINYKLNQYEAMMMFLCYNCFCIYGIIKICNGRKYNIL